MSPPIRSRLPAAWLLLGLLGFSTLHAGESGEPEEIESLRLEIQRMQAELAALQRRLEQVAPEAERSPPEPASASVSASATASRIDCRHR